LQALVDYPNVARVKTTLEVLDAITRLEWVLGEE